MRSSYVWIASLLVCVCALSNARADRIRVLVWDERQPKQKRAYPNYLGNQIASHLGKRPDLVVESVGLDDADQGLSSKALEECDVLVWWGHVRQGEISEAKGKEIVRRVQSGRLALLILHSAHWSVPFMEAMETKAAHDALDRLSAKERQRATVTFLGKRVRKVPPRDRRALLGARYNRRADGSIEIRLERPHCVFPSCCDPVEPSRLRVLLPSHPIAAGIPESFTIPDTEMYDEPFGVPEPDLVIFEESWKDGEHFRSGALWTIGEGKLFYFRPGHETYKVFFEPYPLKIVENAAVWLGDAVLAKTGRSR